MAGIVEIKDQEPSGVLAVELIDLLNLLTAEGPNLIWSILDLEATGDLGEGRSILDLEKQVRSSPNGLVLPWDELCALARRFHQTIDATVVACGNEKSIPKLRAGVDLYTPSKIVIKGIETTLWSVYAKDDKIVRRFKDAFRDVTLKKPIPGAL